MKSKRSKELWRKEYKQRLGNYTKELELLLHRIRNDENCPGVILDLNISVGLGTTITLNVQLVNKGAL